MESGQPTASRDRPKFAVGYLTLRSTADVFPAVLLDLILDLLPFIERAQSSALDRRDVDEHVFAASLRLDKSVALGWIEPLHGAARHFDLPKRRRCYSGRRLGRQGDERVVHSCISMP